MTLTSIRSEARTTHPRGVLAVLLAAGISFALTQTIVLPALPVLGQEYGASATATSWVVTGFLLSASVSTPIIGKLGDVYGRGRVLTVVLALFALGGTINALAGSIELVIVGRVIQGVAGGVFPLSFGIIRDTFPRERVPGAISLVSSVFGVGAGIGLPLSGVIVDHTHPSVVFWISLVAVPAAIAAARVIPRTPTVTGMRIDWTGALLLSGALALLLLGVTQAPSMGWGSPGNVGLLLGGAALLAVWVVVEQRVPQPLIELAVLRQRAVLATNITGLLTGLAMFSGFLLIPQIAQAPTSTGYGLGASVTLAGMLLAPSAVGQLIAGPIAGRLGVRVGFRTTLIIGSALSSSAFLLLALLHDRWWHLALGGLLLGAGVAFAFASMANLIVAAVEQSEVGIATGINTVTRTLGGAFGSALSTAVLASTIGGDGFPSGNGYRLAFGLAALMALLAGLSALRVPKTGGAAAPAA
ncbi:MAG: major facilitator superfamily 1 [Frankiales bacterium]|nr:major facilitator superfamily 1 [Frankiales bacterium]